MCMWVRIQELFIGGWCKGSSLTNCSLLFIWLLTVSMMWALVSAILVSSLHLHSASNCGISNVLLLLIVVVSVLLYNYLDNDSVYRNSIVWIIAVTCLLIIYAQYTKVGVAGPLASSLWLRLQCEQKDADLPCSPFNCRHLCPGLWAA